MYETFEKIITVTLILGKIVFEIHSFNKFRDDTGGGGNSTLNFSLIRT